MFTSEFDHTKCMTEMLISSVNNKLVCLLNKWQDHWGTEFRLPSWWGSDGTITFHTEYSG